MQYVAVAFWGAFLGCAAMSLVGALIAFAGSARRVALTASVSALLSAAYALVFLGWVPVEGAQTLQRLQALTAIVTAAVLAVLLFLLVGAVREREAVTRTRRVIALLAGVCIVLAFIASERQALELGVGVCIALAGAAVAVSARSAWRGDRTGWLALGALSGMSVAMAALDWYAFHPAATPWSMHALGAVGGIVYLLCIAAAMWIRYSYLIEVSKVMTQGPHYDPVTSLPSSDVVVPPAHTEPHHGRPTGVIVVSISNLTMLEELHGRAAYNHALFICASRLRRMALPGAELARLHEDAFLLLFKHPGGAAQLVDQARQVMKRLSRPVTLGVSGDIHKLESSDAAWQASLGVGVLLKPGEMPAEVAVAGAQAMSRTAWSYASRMAWFDDESGSIAELPAAG